MSSAALASRLQGLLAQRKLKQIELSLSLAAGPALGDLTLIMTALDGSLSFESIETEWPELRPVIFELSEDATRLTRGSLRYIVKTGTAAPTIVYTDNLAERKKAASHIVTEETIAAFILTDGQEPLVEGVCPDFAAVWALTKPLASRLIDVSETEDGIRLVKENGKFAVFATERGVRSDEATFDSLEEALKEKASRLYSVFVHWATRNLR